MNSDNPSDSSSQSVRPEDTTVRKQDGVGLPASSIAVNSEPAIPGDDSYKGSQNKEPLWKSVLQIAAVLVALGLLIVNTWQTQITNGTLSELQKQTTLMRQQLVGTQAAFVSFLTPQIDSSIGMLDVLLNNEGKVDAQHVNLSYKIEKRQFPSGEVIGNPQEVTVKDFIIRKEAGYRKQTPFFWQAPQNFPHNLRWPGTVTYAIEGHFDYENGFGEKIPPKRFCVFWLPGYTFNNPPGNGFSQPGRFEGDGTETCDIPTAIRLFHEREKQYSQQNNTQK